MGLEGFGTSQGRSRINTIGTMISVAIGKGTIKSDEWRLGFPDTADVAAEQIDFAFSPAASQVVAYASDVDFNIMIPASRLPMPGRCGTAGSALEPAGRGHHGALHQSISSRVTTPTSASLTERSFSAEGSTWQLQPSAGVQWRRHPASFLARVVAPGIKILGGTRLTPRPTVHVAHVHRPRVPR
jgi:hypothetical protein